VNGRRVARRDWKRRAGRTTKLKGSSRLVYPKPALDSEFKTIDFLTLLDLDALPPTVRNHFLQAGE
jgi:hypothetical protein